MEFKSLGLSDKKMFDSYFAKYPQGISEMTFTNLFSWHFSRNYQHSVNQGHLIISRIEEGRRIFLQPVGGNASAVIRSLFEELPGCAFERVEKSVAVRTEGMHWAEQRDMFDYIYRIEDLQKLAGDRFSAKRNFINRFSRYEPEVLPLSKSLIDECLSLQDEWCNLRHCHEDESMHAEDLAIREALSNSAELGIRGIALRVSGKIAGFAVGEPLSRDVVVEHFEKADSRFTGIYQFLNQHFAMIWPGFKFMNREQDLGVEGLRKAKLSYHPSHLIEKYRSVASV